MAGEGSAGRRGRGRGATSAERRVTCLRTCEIVGTRRAVELEDGTGALVPLRALWAERPLLVTFIRRFGCPLCRAWALQLKSIAGTCAALGVSMALVGWERGGLADFERGGFFSCGRVLVDPSKSVVHALGLRRLGFLDGYGLLDATAISAYRTATSRGIEGDFEGDGLQLGGTFLVLPGGKTVYAFRQTSFSDHPSLDEILHRIGTHVAHLSDDGLDFLDRSDEK